MPNSTSPDKLRPIDFCSVLDRIGGDTSFLKELLDIYLREYAEKKRLLEEAITREDFIQVLELGHSLKGASANLSLTRLQRVAFSLETAGRERQLQSAQDAARNLDMEIQTLKAFLAGNPLSKLV
jgi:HPt (histidine-containing phosphotransfer) domain-containing protein